MASGKDLWELDGVGEVGCNGNLDRFVAFIVIIYVVGTPHGVSLLACFVVLDQVESILIKKYKILCNNSLLRSEEKKYMV